MIPSLHISRLNFVLAFSVICVILIGVVFSQIENWDFTTTVYYLVLTATGVTSQSDFSYDVGCYVYPDPTPISEFHVSSCR